MRRLIAGVTLSLVAAGCGSAPAPDATGAQIYAQLCARCHAGDLSGRIGPPLGPGSEAASKTDSFLRSTVERGRGRMPSFRRTLSSEQVDRLISFLREVQQP